MATAASERLVMAAGVLAAITVALAGCGNGATGGVLGSIRPAHAPAGWHVSALPNGRARLAYPPGWHATRTDPGTMTYIRGAAPVRIAGYLNVTPGQGNETLANWARFRPGHNAREGNSHVVRHSSATAVPFSGGRGSCVDDSYRTTVTTYREIACLVAGNSGSSVVVAAAPQARWAAERGQLLTALRAFAVR